MSRKITGIKKLKQGFLVEVTSIILCEFDDEEEKEHYAFSDIDDVNHFIKGFFSEPSK